MYEFVFLSSQFCRNTASEVYVQLLVERLTEVFIKFADQTQLKSNTV